MDRDDHRRYFIVGSVIMEIVTPVFRQRLETDYKGKGFGCLQDFINSKPVIHILFHLRHRNIKCCVDSTNCRNRGTLPLNYSQWDLLYTENPGPPNQPSHLCHCLYTTNNVKLDDLDITLTSLILLNCCNLTSNEEILIKELRKFKNNYLSHNTKGAITEKEFQTLWKDLTTYVLQLDPSKQDDFIRIKNRPLDESLCNKYFVCLLDIHKKLEDIDTRIQNIGVTTSDIHSTSTEILSTMNINNIELKTTLEEIIRIQTNKHAEQKQPDTPYLLGQSIATLHHERDLQLIVDDDWQAEVSDLVVMDDGRMVICLPFLSKLLICNTVGPLKDSIFVQDEPLRATAVNKSIVAVTLIHSNHIEVYDINNKLKLKSISVPRMIKWSDITISNEKLVVRGQYCLVIIDYQTEEMVQTIETDCDPVRLHGSGDRIFYLGNSNFKNSNKLYRYSFTDDRHQTFTLPSPPIMITAQQDGSLYILCREGLVHHLTVDCKLLITVIKEGLELLDSFVNLHYNCKQKKLVFSSPNSIIKIFREK